MSISLQRSVLMLPRTRPRNYCFTYRVRLPAVTWYTRKQRGEGRTKHAETKDLKKQFIFPNYSKRNFSLFFRKFSGVRPLHHSVDLGELAAQQVFVSEILVHVDEKEPLEVRVCAFRTAQLLQSQQSFEVSYIFVHFCRSKFLS